MSVPPTETFDEQDSWPIRRVILTTLLAAPVVAGPFAGAAIDTASRGQVKLRADMTQRVCKVSYDPTPSDGVIRKKLTSAECPANRSANKGDACFCVVDVEGQPYAAAGKVAFLLPGGGYSW
jgi:hypothetical protein